MVANPAPGSSRGGHVVFTMGMHHQCLVFAFVRFPTNRCSYDTIRHVILGFDHGHHPMKQPNHLLQAVLRGLGEEVFCHGQIMVRQPSRTAVPCV